MSIILPNPPGQSGGFVGNAFELETQKRLTHEFILTSPVIVILTPRQRTKQPTGGYTWSKLPDRAPQTVKLVEPGSAITPVQLPDGEVRELAYMLIAEWDAEIGLYDVFELDGQLYEVAGMYPFNGWERRAEVIRHGS